jgi:hypothetical protein
MVLHMLLTVVLAALAGLAGLLAARAGRGRIQGGQSIGDAFAAGVLVGLLVDLVPRLIGGASILLARLMPALQPAELRSVAASLGPLVIQNLAAALVIGVYIVSLRAQRAQRRDSEAGEQRTAPLFALALAVCALADGMAAAGSSLPLTAPLTFGLVGGLALGYAGRGVALASGFGTLGEGFGWLALAAVLGGLVNSLGASLARMLGFEQATAIAVPALACAVVLLVVSVATILGPGLGSNLRRLPVPGFLAGLGLTLVAARLMGANPL